MNTTRRKMSRVADELFSYFFNNIGSIDVKLEMRQLEDGYELCLYSPYPPSARKEVVDLERFLNPAERNEGMEEYYWELAGGGTGQDSQLMLIGQMLDRAEVTITETDVRLVVFKQFD